MSSPRTTGADDRHARALAELDVPLPPVVVHRPTKRVLDGVHRIRAAELRGESDVEVRYFDGGEEEAFLLAVQLNSAHGKPLSFDDRTAAARRIIASHPHWSDRRIASVTCLSAKTVGVLRGCSTGGGPQSNKRVGLDGRARPLHPAEGRLLAGELLAQDPDLSLRELARRAGMSVATASDVRQRFLQGRELLPPRLRGGGPAESGGPKPCGQDGDDGSRGAGAPGGLSGTGGTGGSGGAGRAQSPALLESLRRDPSVRHSESGRRILQLLSIHPTGPSGWQKFVHDVPAHRADVVARIARDYAEAWLHVARALESNS
ncbi:MULTISPECIES: streptomycin biosynthesis protein [unclassified Streptomyces]|uniref:ParB/RepB/Spo0J family partition protein n=1 Tax=unclassified Streptomyces TaxID=2593676 RepID=UPI002E8214C8|nr:streptomycin biosynthesis protein [Streptomyces sp. NBC_00589]WTI38500.1 streptomycin biosynthesis protein [Streptomyces sp. NBC_00775]WUB27821.1 streptomycin biosynthesis protein [Streptomyces sp. NBC_00589]